jgi:hypothetical protein
MARTNKSRLLAALLEVVENATATATDRLRAIEYILILQGKLKLRNPPRPKGNAS